ncbi:MAG: replicative DNA helicase [Candidatus Margulisbacteria bacterium]|jgi:replicative DNA helicase|nr:replicative DNA helicase [Candidatus Margulisiibacteriota bacterium]
MPEERVPPQNLEAEQNLLGALLIDQEAVLKVIDRLQPESFYLPAHQNIYQAVQSLAAQNKKIDMLTVTEELKQKNALPEGGRAYLADLANTVVTPAHAGEYAEIVERNYVMRSIIEAGHGMASTAYQPDGNPDEIVENAQKTIFDLAQRNIKQGFQHLRVPLDIAYDDLTRKSANPEAGGLLTGYDELDQITGGFQNTNMIVIAARPSVGKTALALNIAAHVALRRNAPVGIFSLEMSKEELATRLLTTDAKLNAHSIKTGNLSAEDQRKLSQSLANLSNAPIYIDDSPNTILQIQTKARRLKIEKDIQLIVVDFLTLITSTAGRQESRYLEVSNWARALKNLAKELNIPVIVIAQLNREVEKHGLGFGGSGENKTSGRGSRPPRMSDLRDSGEIEQVADVVLLIHRLSYQDYDSSFGAEDNTVQLIVAKNRNGPTGKAELVFLKAFTRFERKEKMSVPLDVQI